jgi:hypothetical protein
LQPTPERTEFAFRSNRSVYPSMDDDKPTQRVPADGADAAKSPQKEVVFNRYELLGELGKGGMGVVWLALDEELNAKVALKFLREEMTSEADALRELKGEVIINRDLSHPHIIKTFDFVTNGRASAISMEYVSGTNLHKMKAQRPGRFFDVDDIARWVEQLCDAMHYAHQQKVVHRDIKPANLMINERGDLKVGDFGIGRTVADTVNRVTRNSAGTPPYMSPQQTMGEKATPADDIYSIGATIYDLLTGDPPFFRGAIREQTLAKVPPSMAARREELGRAGKPIPAPWEKAVAACLAKDPSARPPTAQAVREMLEGKAQATPGGGRKRPAIPSWAVAAGLGAVVAAAGLATWKLGRPSPARPAAAAAPASEAAVSQPLSAPAVEVQTARAPEEKKALPPPAVEAVQPTGPVELPPKAAPAPTLMPPPARRALTRSAEELVDSGKITMEEGVALSAALRSQKGEPEKALATRLLIDHSLSVDDWRAFSTLAPTDDQAVIKLRPLWAAGIIKENEFGWLREALGGRKGDAEQTLARQLVDERTLSLAQWKEQTQLYPHLDPLAEKVRPLIEAGAVSPEEGKWLRDALAGAKEPTEKKLASRLVEEKGEKGLTPRQWRAQTQFSYLPKEDATIDPDHLPPAIDLPLSRSSAVRLLRMDPGLFIRGSPKEELGRRTNELAPDRLVIVKPFFIGIYEVTQAQFGAIMPRSPSYWRGNPSWPIDQVNWSDVAGGNGFLARLNRILTTRYGGTLVADLPSEDEWEYACRAGTQTSFNNGRNITNVDSDAALDPLANYNRAAGGSPKAVGSYLPNAWGLYDMHGNVSEWCQNRYLRGGSWQAKAANCRAAWRTQISADASPSNQVGFRLVLRVRTGEAVDLR